jgi:hypothetical protein
MTAQQEMILGICREMEQARIPLFSSLVCVAMSDEYSELDQAFAIGDVYNFQLEHFADSKDVNIQLLYDLILKMDATQESLMNLNGIDWSEIE